MAEKVQMYAKTASELLRNKWAKKEIWSKQTRKC